MKPSLAGVVVLYQPKEEVLENILSYHPSLFEVIIVDNSEEKNLSLITALKALPRVRYVDNHGNQGIAAALNAGITMLLKTHAQWVLTMDQDSKATPEMLDQMIAYITSHPIGQVGIVAPFHSVAGKKPTSPEQYEEIASTMTSGNLLQVAAYKAVGPFEEKLFMDYVDHEYCLRLQEAGYKIIQVNQAILVHQLGAFQEISVAGHTVGYTNHNHLRRYYMTRNRLYVMNRYKNATAFIKREQREFWLELRKIILFEKDKYRKVASILKGYWDYKRGKFGKLA